MIVAHSNNHPPRSSVLQRLRRLPIFAGHTLSNFSPRSCASLCPTVLPRSARPSSPTARQHSSLFWMFHLSARGRAIEYDDVWLLASMHHLDRYVYASQTKTTRAFACHAILCSLSTLVYFSGIRLRLNHIEIPPDIQGPLAACAWV